MSEFLEFSQDGVGFSTDNWQVRGLASHTSHACLLGLNEILKDS